MQKPLSGGFSVELFFFFLITAVILSYIIF